MNLEVLPTIWSTRAMRKITVHFKNGYQFPITGKISILLGFGGKEVKITKMTVSPYVADISGTRNSIYAYCDIVQPQVVGQMLNF